MKPAFLVLSMGVAAGIGVIVHELVHYIAASALADNPTLEWHGRPEVRYYTDSAAVVRAVNLSPTVLGLSVALVTLAGSRPLLSPSTAVLLAFAAGLVGFSPEDWSVEKATVSS